MKITKYLFPFFFLLGLTPSFGQQLPTFSLFRDNWNVLNPASVSSDYLFSNNPMSIFATYRNQWNGVEGAPETALLNWEYVLDYWNVVTGLTLMHDQAGEISTTGLFGRFGYRINLDRRGDRFINVALNVGVVQYRADLADLNLGETILDLANDLIYYPDFGVGFMYYHDDLFYLGLSIPQTFGLSTSVRNDNGDFEIKRNQHFYLMGGTYFDVYAFNSDASYLELSGFLKYVPNAPLAIDVHARMQLGEVLYVGLGGGLSQTARAEAGIIIGESMNFNAGQVRVGAAYGIGLSRYAQAFGNSLELHAIYSFDIGR
ncbi:MAG TPA: PorP/SprF family type IX secretion system membrane protein [Saprospiraceae bacterium]|nr:PorP/SprF family type IX secretion system membrane protein [Saprospiraceae bacterium]